MRRVIVNSTPLISLHRIGRLSLLREMYGEIVIPEAVFQEVIVKHDSLQNFILENRNWIRVCRITHSSDKRMYRARLHSGEVEVMILAQELNADLVVIDDLTARKTAEYLGLPLTGTIGILLKAKETGRIPLVMPLIEMMSLQGIYFSAGLKKMIQKLSGE